MVDDLEFYFETINGTLIILLVAALAFLSYYVVDQKRHRGLSWRDCMFGAPPGIGIALPMIGVKLGLLVTRGSRWTWQQFGGGEPMTTWQLHLSLVGTAIASLALLWLVRVLSRAHFGDWPWIAAGSAALAYIIGNTASHAWGWT
jgi:hypothetical protein